MINRFIVEFSLIVRYLLRRQILVRAKQTLRLIAKNKQMVNISQTLTPAGEMHKQGKNIRNLTRSKDTIICYTNCWYQEKVKIMSSENKQIMRKSVKLHQKVRITCRVLVRTLTNCSDAKSA